MRRWKLSPAVSPVTSMAYGIRLSVPGADMPRPSVPLGTSLEARWSRYSYPYFSHNKTKVALTGTVARMSGFRAKTLNLLNHNVWERS